MIDLRELDSDEIYGKLSLEVRAFFDNYPIEPTEDKRLKVTRVLSSWKYYMDEVSSKKSEIDFFDYAETQRAIARQEEAKWKIEQQRVTNWVVCNHPQLKHAEIFKRHASVQQILQARKAAKKARGAEQQARGSAVFEVPSDSSQGVEIEQDSGSRT